MRKKSGKHSRSNSNKPDRREYWKDYWSDNRDVILQKRRDKYNNDPEYKQKMKDIRRDNYEKNKVLKVKKPSSEFVVSSVPPVIMEVHGKKIMMFDVEYFAKRIGRSVATVRYWERRGILPKTPFRKGRKCLYSDSMIASVYEALSDQGFPGNVDLEEFSDYVAASWQSLEVI